MTIKTLDAAALAKLINSIKRRGELLDNDIQKAGVSCLMQVTLYGNTTYVNDLVNALPQGARKHAFVEWCLAHGQVSTLDKTNDADKAKLEKGLVFKLDKSKPETDPVAAFASKWWTFKPEKPLAEAFDVHKAVAQLVKRVAKASKQGAELQGVQDALKQLKALEQTLATTQETL